MSDSLGLSVDVTERLAAMLPEVARDTVAAVIQEGPSYSGALQGPMAGEQHEGTARRGFEQRHAGIDHRLGMRGRGRVRHARR